MADNATVTAPTYLQLISVDKEKKNTEARLSDAQDANLGTQTAILKLNKDISTAKKRVAAAQRAVPYSVAVEFKATALLAELVEQLTFTKEVAATRFTDAEVL